MPTELVNVLEEENVLLSAPPPIRLAQALVFWEYLNWLAPES